MLRFESEIISTTPYVNLGQVEDDAAKLILYFSHHIKTPKYTIDISLCIEFEPAIGHYQKPEQIPCMKE